MKRVAIYDMDGTIVCSLHRYRTDNTGQKIDLKYWRDNEHRAMEDSLLPLAEQYKADLEDKDCFVIIATARILREADNMFINTVLGKPDYIISRKENDSRSGGLLKVLGLKKLFSLKQFSKVKEKAVFYEDNHSYLKTVCDYFNITGMYIPSKQGH
jgi:hypothetical protein